MYRLMRLFIIALIRTWKQNGETVATKIFFLVFHEGCNFLFNYLQAFNLFSKHPHHCDLLIDVVTPCIPFFYTWTYHTYFFINQNYIKWTCYRRGILFLRIYFSCQRTESTYFSASARSENTNFLALLTKKNYVLFLAVKKECPKSQFTNLRVIWDILYLYGQG